MYIKLYVNMSYQLILTSKKALFGVKLFVAVTRDKSMETPLEMMGFSSDGWPTFPQPGLLVGLRNRPSVEWGFSRPYVS